MSDSGSDVHHGFVVDDRDIGVIDRRYGETDVSHLVVLATGRDAVGDLRGLRQRAEERLALFGGELVDPVELFRNLHVGVPEPSVRDVRSLEHLHGAGVVQVDVRVVVRHQGVAYLAALVRRELCVAVPGVDEPRVVVVLLVGCDGLVAQRLQGPSRLLHGQLGHLGAVENVDGGRRWRCCLLDHSAGGAGEGDQAEG